MHCAPLLIPALLLLSVCGPLAIGQEVATQAGTRAAATPLTTQLSTIVQQQAVAWNEGDIDAFMKPYWNSEEMTFSSSGETQRGWTATRDRYKSRYPDRKTMGQLTFSELEVTSLGPTHALMLGRWQLQRDEPIGGNFTLVWRKFQTGWQIIHDHSSAKRD